MTWHRTIWRLTFDLVRRRRLDRELDAEFDAHLDCATSEYVASGMSLDAARRAALRDFGGVARSKEAYRDVRGFPVFEALAQDARFALRLLRKSPVFTTIAVVTLALGIGANGAIFGVADALLARPLPGIDTRRLAVVAIQQKTPAAAADYLDWKRLNTSFASLAAYRQRDANMTGVGPAERLYAADVTSNFFPTLGLQPALGRIFTVRNDAVDEPAAVLTHGFWQRRFGGDPGVVGRTIDVDGLPHTIVGVMPAGVEMPMPTDVWLPLALTPAEQSRRDVPTLRVVGRLKPDATLDQAAAEFAAIARQLEESFPATNRNRRTHVMPLIEYVQGSITRSALVLLLACVGIVLGIACVNIAGLQVARVTTRERERNLRTALGASRWRIVQLVLVENLVIAAIGGAAGIFVASGCVSLLLASMPADIVRLIPGFAHIRIDGRALAFMTLATLASGVLSGVAPAIGSARRRLTSTESRQRLRSAFVVAQIAVALVLVVIGLLFVRGQRNLLQLHQVPDAAGVVVLSVNLPVARYPDAASRSRFYDAALAGLAAVPGASSAATCSTVPLSNNGTTWGRVDIEGRHPSPSLPAPSAVEQTVSSNFFHVMGIPLRAGRTFDATDRARTTSVVIISDVMATRYWPDGDAIAKRIRIHSQQSEPWLEIVGIAGDVLYDWTRRVPEAVVYRPVAQAPLAASTFAVRVAGDAATSAPALTRALAKVDPLLPAFGVMSLDAAIAESFAGTSQITAMMSMLGGLAFAIAIVGVYGIVAYTVAARTREFGVRMALGAQRADIFRLVMRHAIVISGLGVGVGVAAAVAASRVTRGVVFTSGSATELTTLVGTAGVVAVATIVACFGPARLATRADPVDSLRAD